MTTLAKLYNVRTSREELRQKAGAAFLEIAYAILSESDTTENHANRVVWARRMITTDIADLAFGCLGWVLRDSDVQESGGAATDEQIRAAAAAAMPYVVPADLETRPDLTTAEPVIIAYILSLELALGI